MVDRNNTNIVFDRCIKIIEDLHFEPCEDLDHPFSLSHLLWMAYKAKSEEFSIDKQHRWLGYIQGCLVCMGIITVEEERNFTRPLFS